MISLQMFIIGILLIITISILIIFIMFPGKGMNTMRIGTFSAVFFFIIITSSTMFFNRVYTDIKIDILHIDKDYIQIEDQFLIMHSNKLIPYTEEVKCLIETRKINYSGETLEHTYEYIYEQ